MNRPFLTLLFLILLFPGASFAYRNADIAEESFAYRAVERLTALGLIDTIINGHKPWPASEVARLIREAEGNLGRLKNVAMEIEAIQTLKKLKELFKKEIAGKSEIRFHPFHSVRADYLFLDSPEREIPIDIGTGDQIRAFINPLTSGWDGASLADTHNFRLQTGHTLDLTRRVAAVGRGHFLFRQNGALPEYARFGFDRLYLRAEWGNWGLQAGRDALAWGPSGDGGVFHSLNATPPDMIKLSNIHPFHYPWIFKHLGPSQVSAFIALLEGDREFPRAYMTGWKLSFRPHRNFEFGFTHEIMSGGEGSEQASFGTRLADSLGLFSSLSDADPNISNRVGGFDFTWRIPRWRGLEFYYEVLMEDTQSASHFDIMFLDGAIHQFGVFLPRLNNTGTKTLRLEVTRSGFRPYRHHQYTSGWTHDRRLIGSEIGPDAIGFLLEYESRPTYYFNVRHSLAVEKRDSDRYALLNVATAVQKTADNPSETRIRWMSGFEWLPDSKKKISLNLGYERVHQFNFTPGWNADNFLVNLGVTVYPGI